MRMGLSQLLQSSGKVEVCGEAGSVGEAIQLMQAMPPVDLFVIDISLPDRSGLELIRDLKIMGPGIR